MNAINQQTASPNLYQRMLNVSTEVMNVEKNTTVSTGKSSSYKAVADYDVVVAVKKAEAKYGIISVPVSQELVNTQVMSYTDSNGNQKSQFVDIVKVTMQIINADNPSDSIMVSAFGRGIDSGDKGFGKASTYARKYCLLNAYKIATGEDPSKDASPEVRYNTPAPTVATTATAQPIPAPVVETRDERAAAISEANAAKTGDEVTMVWEKYRVKFGKDVEFVKAIAGNPNNPKKGRSTK